MAENDAVWQRDEIDSPCVQICILQSETGLCIGCRRTGAEIAVWSRLSPEERQRIMAELPDRTLAKARRGGARARRRTGG